MRKLFSMFFLSLFAVSIVGCGEGEIDVPEGTPPTPEAGSDDYDSYNSSGKEGPGGGAAK